MAVLKRYQLLHYMNTGTTANPTWSLVNEGVTTFDSTLEPETEDVHYVGEQNARTLTNGVNATYAYTAGYDNSDAVSQLLYQVSAGQILDKEVQVVHVETWGADNTALTARMMTYAVSPTKEPSGDPGSVLTMEGNLNQVGSITLGTFNATTKVFTATEAADDDDDDDDQVGG